jgi:hypothetical protein
MEVVFSQQAELDREEIADTIAINSACSYSVYPSHPRALLLVLTSVAVFISAT